MTTRGRPRTNSYEPLLNFIIQFKREHYGNDPTQRQMMDAMGWTGNTSVTHGLKQLVRDGKLIIHDKKYFEIVGLLTPEQMRERAANVAVTGAVQRCTNHEVSETGACGLEIASAIKNIPLIEEKTNGTA